MDKSTANSTRSRKFVPNGPKKHEQDSHHAFQMHIDVHYVVVLEIHAIEDFVFQQESLQARCEIQSMNQQLTQQTEYCSSLGSACCTLLWRVSRCEESIQSILVGVSPDKAALTVPYF